MQRAVRLLLLFLALVIYPCSAQAFSNKEISCLARNVYFESRNQDLEGMIAVAYVTMNRLADDRYPDTVCKVVYEKKQFSWTNNKRRADMKNNEMVQLARRVASEVIEKKVKDPTLGATHFHKKGKRPPWRRFCRATRAIDDHIFYRCPPKR